MRRVMEVYIGIVIGNFIYQIFSPEVVDLSIAFERSFFQGAIVFALYIVIFSGFIGNRNILIPEYEYENLKSKENEITELKLQIQKLKENENEKMKKSSESKTKFDLS